MRLLSHLVGHHSSAFNALQLISYIESHIAEHATLVGLNIKTEVALSTQLLISIKVIQDIHLYALIIDWRAYSSGRSLYLHLFLFFLRLLIERNVWDVQDRGVILLLVLELAQFQGASQLFVFIVHALTLYREKSFIQVLSVSHGLILRYILEDGSIVVIMIEVGEIAKHIILIHLLIRSLEAKERVRILVPESGICIIQDSKLMEIELLKPRSATDVEGIGVVDMSLELHRLHIDVELIGNIVQEVLHRQCGREQQSALMGHLSTRFVEPLQLEMLGILVGKAINVALLVQEVFGHFLPMGIDGLVQQEYRDFGRCIGKGRLETTPRFRDVTRLRR